MEARLSVAAQPIHRMSILARPKEAQSSSSPCITHSVSFPDYDRIHIYIHVEVFIAFILPNDPQ